MVPLGIIAAVLLLFVKETPLATEHEITAESLADGQLRLTEFDADDQDDLTTSKRS